MLRSSVLTCDLHKLQNLFFSASTTTTYRSFVACQGVVSFPRVFFSRRILFFPSCTLRPRRVIALRLCNRVPKKRNSMSFCGMPSKDLTPQERVTNEWDQMAGEWDDLASGYAAGFEQLLWSKIDKKDSENWLVLDFGCGTGLLSDRLRSKVKNIVAMDVSSKMIDVLDEKILGQEWTNTQAINCVLADLANASLNVRESVEAHYGSMDLIVASSVLSFIPPKDVAPTMEILGKFLKPGGRLVHSDWTRNEAKHPDGLDSEKATAMYAQAGLSAVSMDILQLNAGEGAAMEVFFGVAQK